VATLPAYAAHAAISASSASYPRRQSNGPRSRSLRPTTAPPQRSRTRTVAAICGLQRETVTVPKVVFVVRVAQRSVASAARIRLDDDRAASVTVQAAILE